MALLVSFLELYFSTFQLLFWSKTAFPMTQRVVLATQTKNLYYLIITGWKRHFQLSFLTSVSISYLKKISCNGSYDKRKKIEATYSFCDSHVTTRYFLGSFYRWLSNSTVTQNRPLILECVARTWWNCDKEELNFTVLCDHQTTYTPSWQRIMEGPGTRKSDFSTMLVWDVYLLLSWCL